LFTFLAIMLIYVLIAAISIRFLVKESVTELLGSQLQSSKREAMEVAKLVGFQLENEISREKIIAVAQQSITDTEDENGFLGILDWSGKQICHPDITQVGQIVDTEHALVTSVGDESTTADLYELVDQKRTGSDVGASEIVYLYPVANSDLIVAAYANTDKLQAQVKDLGNRFYMIFSIMGFTIVLGSVILVRLIGSSYEKRLEAKNQKLEDEVFNLSKLNKDLENYQQRVVETKPTLSDDESEKRKKRILTYVRNELRPVAIDDIAYIFMESTVTYVVCTDGSQSTSNLSLDELFSHLDVTHFYRANRQFIIAISAIRKIIKYGNNQLKLIVEPGAAFNIIISKNRASEFKQWLNS